MACHLDVELWVVHYGRPGGAGLTVANLVLLGMGRIGFRREGAAAAFAQHRFTAEHAVEWLAASSNKET